MLELLTCNCLVFVSIFFSIGRIGLTFIDNVSRVLLVYPSDFYLIPPLPSLLH